MLKVLIINNNDNTNINIAKKIAELYSEVSFFTISNIDQAIEQIHKEKPQIVVVNLSMKDSKGRDLLERLAKWDFEILVYNNDELYCIQDAKVSKIKGYVLKNIDSNFFNKI
ncbi:MAG: response regulator [Candidatus Kapabacteria bacterium]|nr:response regulator [Candidatus Kapabacteria bacterium]